MQKPFLPAIFFLFIYIHCNAQTIDTLYSQLRYIESLRDYDDSTWVIITGDANMHLINYKGEIIESVAIGEDIGYNKRILNVFDGFRDEQDSFTYIHAYDSHCDYWENAILMKVNKEGVVVDTFPVPASALFSTAMPYLPGINHPKYIFPQQENLAIYYDPSHKELIPLHSNILRIAVSDIGDIAVLTYDSIYYFVMQQGHIELSDQIEVQLGFFSYHDLFFTSTGELIFVSENLILWFDNELQNPEEFETESGYTISLVKETNEKIVIATMDQEDNLYAGVLGLDKQVIYEKIFDYQELFFSDVLWIKDSLYAFTGLEYYPEDKTYTHLLTVNFASAEQDKTDIAIDDIKFNKVLTAGGYHCYGDSTNIYSIENITLTITNHGTRPIDRMIITPLKSYCYFFCTNEILGENEIADMDLQPGETDEFYIGNMGVHARYNDLQDELCLFAVQPDMHIDANHEDNKICFSTTVSTDDEKLNNKPTLFPNPVIDLLYVSNYEKVKTITLSNSNGIQLTADIDYAVRGIDMNQYLPGMYIIEIQLKNGDKIVERIVKM